MKSSGTRRDESTFYNEIDRNAAQWLGNLIATKALPQGVVDDRSVADISSGEIIGYEQCHFFAGIGGWPLALKLAGWRDDVWTGSCPCQPLSSAGQHKGHADERHLWPAFYRLIAECRPATIFGEQVASNVGREWLAGVRADLEAIGYAVGAADLCAASVGAPQKRQRLYWVAYTKSGRQRHNREKIQGQARGRSRVGFQPWDRTIQTCDSRRIEPTISPLAPRLPGSVGRLRAYGNAVVPQVAATFVRAFSDAIQ